MGGSFLKRTDEENEKGNLARTEKAASFRSVASFLVLLVLPMERDYKISDDGSRLPGKPMISALQLVVGDPVHMLVDKVTKDDGKIYEGLGVAMLHMQDVTDSTGIALAARNKGNAAGASRLRIFDFVQSVDTGTPQELRIQPKKAYRAKEYR